MEKTDICYGTYLQILKEELVPAMGCTEPIALAYCAAKARKVLEKLPDSVEVSVSGNMIKNVKSVIVPNTNGMKGIGAAVAAGIVAGKDELVLEVLSETTQEDKKAIAEYLDTHTIAVKPLESEFLLDMIVEVRGGEDIVRVRISDYHTNIVWIEKNGVTLFQKGVTKAEEVDIADRSLLTVEKICDFADTVDIEDVKGLLEEQISCNTAIAEEGLKNTYGANVGSVLLKFYGKDVKNRAKAMAAAGSDARMNGCEMPVIINSGSGNQGMTASLPVIEYAKEYNKSREELYRALVVSNLTAIHQKTGIGRLSAYCGAISAGCAAGAGIAYLLTGDYATVAHTVVNSLAITSGVVCDGAKASCAGKIATAVDAGILGFCMYQDGQQFYGGDGIVSKGIENTIQNVSRLGKDGMKETDKEIIRIMTESC